MRWSGYDWNVFTSASRGPGPNSWSADCVSVDDKDVLSLSIKQVGSAWPCAEISSVQSFGLGTYRWQVDSDLSDLEPWAVLGLFTYDWRAPAPYNEIDIEASKWGWPTEKNAGMLSCHADPESNSWVRTFPWSNKPPYRCQFVWRAKTVTFLVVDADGKTLFNAGSRRRFVHKDEKAYCNLWLSKGHAPERGSLTIRISDFSHSR